MQTVWVVNAGIIPDGSGVPTGTPLSDPPLVEMISEDPVLRNTKLIAEAWDCDGLFQVRATPPVPRLLGPHVFPSNISGSWCLSSFIVEGMTLVQGTMFSVTDSVTAECKWSPTLQEISH